jgi:hypothetical protein
MCWARLYPCVNRTHVITFQQITDLVICARSPENHQNGDFRYSSRAGLVIISQLLSLYFNIRLKRANAYLRITLYTCGVYVNILCNSHPCNHQ